MASAAKRAIVRSVAVACAVTVHAGAAAAESCEISRDYILQSASDDLPQRAQFYKTILYKSCLETLKLPNVKDAFVLKTGAIAVLPRMNGVSATAGTLAQFCTLFPKLTLRFITDDERRIVRNISRVVLLPVETSTSCTKIVDSG